APGGAKRRRAPHPAASPCGLALVQAVLSLRCLPLAHGRPERANASRSAMARAKPGLEAIAQRRRDPDARYLGVPLVRFVGLGLSLGREGSCQSRVRQRAPPAEGPEMAPAPQRAFPGL